MALLQVGDKIPDLSGINENGETISLKQFEGKKLALFFYPKSGTPGCTAEACSLRDYYAEIKSKGVEVLGVSPDSFRKQKNFIKKFNFPYSLIADTDKTITQAFGAWGPKIFWGRHYEGTLRSTFLIDENGIIEKVFDKVDTEEHAKQILEVL